ncbi:diacylglycerol/lipid kinase family protein [Williamwhitmania taraxaci]|uniref:Lipid kinase, YegS/Rv2252/BmrU family n=1 Tax=Williamwhitmania taraxaci TaxID=1640674 RepID=A0A1G6IDF5_9BACT|nr:YegS/Rv2252/BmrU family lipid kinase [Williamwhitmania taraxaci]SDC04524.1 lipid kinase, YegS/Rv2252/BmrU family [Williamwhitmania taraxaci]
MESICFIVNSQKRKLGPFQNRVAKCFSDSYKVKFLLTHGYRSAEHLANTAVEQGFRYIIAVGGDGTVNEVINGVMLHPENVRKNVVVGVLPKGTGNDFARNIGATTSVSNLRKVIESGQHKTIDLINITYTDNHGHTTSHYCNNIADVGVGPSTILSADKLSGWLGSNLAFSFSALKGLFQKPHLIEITADTFNFKGEIKCVCLANGRYFGSGIGIAPLADLTNGTMEVVVIEDVSPLLFVKLMTALRAAKPIIHRKVHYHTAKQVTITAERDTLPLDLDGEVLGHAPIYAEALPACINVLGENFTQGQKN